MENLIQIDVEAKNIDNMTINNIIKKQSYTRN